MTMCALVEGSRDCNPRCPRFKSVRRLHRSGCSSAWESGWFGSSRSWDRSPPPRLLRHGDQHRPCGLAFEAGAAGVSTLGPFHRGTVWTDPWPIPGADGFDFRGRDHFHLGRVRVVAFPVGNREVVGSTPASQNHFAVGHGTSLRCQRGKAGIVTRVPLHFVVDHAQSTTAGRIL